MRKESIILACGLLAGCETVRMHSVAPEVVYQTLNAVDYSQTLDVARSPTCYHERDPITRWMIGEHPSQKGVAAAWAADALTHYAVSAWLDRVVEANDSRTWRVVRFVWHAATIATSANAVSNNASLGMRPFAGAQNCEPQSLPPGPPVGPPRH